MKKIKLLFVDDEVRFLKTLSERLALRDFDVTCAVSAEEALSLPDIERFEIAIVDLNMPGMGGEKLLQALRKLSSDLEIVILTGHGTIESAVECTRRGAYRYLQKPCETDELLSALLDAYRTRMEKRFLHDEEKMAAILNASEGASPLSILRMLRDLDDLKNK